MQIDWKPKAKQDLDDALAYGANTFGARAADRFWQEVLTNVDYLITNPYMGRLEPFLAHLHLPYRCLVVHRHYKLIYWVDEEHDTVNIVALWDTRRNPEQIDGQL